MDKAKYKVATEIKRCELNMAINENKPIDVINSIAEEILRLADGKYELSEILDSVAYKKYLEYLEKLAHIS
ncbi:MAG: hypothetical protein GT589_02615 [Peptoclostridium sp.]|uniref:hypothetical protein n=1 Tax=Peptoclostridium sp. TaxID=1904860 RepID=UPI00139C7E94|nr:hypothetical protein [Peptoclostridium sp.]MZQ75032.1 hypothetical protein [Peptoclostridium sp.]